MQHVERLLGVQGADRPQRVEPERQPPRPAPLRRAERDDVRACHAVAVASMRIAQRQHAHRIGLGQRPHEVKLYRDGGVVIVAAESGKQKADVHGFNPGRVSLCKEYHDGFTR